MGGDPPDGFRYAVSFIADDQNQLRPDVFAVIKGRAVQLGGKNGEALRLQLRQAGRKIPGKSEAYAENAAHGGAKHLGGEDIRTVRTQEDAIEACGIGCTKDGADIAGILQAVQRDEAAPGKGPGPDPQHGGDALGRLCIADGGKDMLRQEAERNTVLLNEFIEEM